MPDGKEQEKRLLFNTEGIFASCLLGSSPVCAVAVLQLLCWGLFRHYICKWDEFPLINCVAECWLQTASSSRGDSFAPPHCTTLLESPQLRLNSYLSCPVRALTDRANISAVLEMCGFLKHCRGWWNTILAAWFGPETPWFSLSQGSRLCCYIHFLWISFNACVYT